MAEQEGSRVQSSDDRVYDADFNRVGINRPKDGGNGWPNERERLEQISAHHRQQCDEAKRFLDASRVTKHFRKEYLPAPGSWWNPFSNKQICREVYHVSNHVTGESEERVVEYEVDDGPRIWPLFWFMLNTIWRGLTSLIRRR